MKPRPFLAVCSRRHKKADSTARHGGGERGPQPRSAERWRSRRTQHIAYHVQGVSRHRHGCDEDALQELREIHGVPTSRLQEGTAKLNGEGRRRLQLAAPASQISLRLTVPAMVLLMIRDPIV